MPRGNWRACCALAGIIFLGTAHAATISLKQPLAQAPEINAEQQSNGSLERKADHYEQQEHLKPHVIGPSGPIAQQQGTGDANKSNDQGTEFWTIFGHRLKITDTLLAAFTFLLVLVGAGQIFWVAETTSDGRKLQRAFLFEMVTFADRPNGNVEMRVTWENSGATPTKHALHRFNVCIIDEKDWPIKRDFPDQPSIQGTEDEGPFVLGPKAQSFQFFDIPKDAIVDMLNGRKFGYVWGWADYNDIFRCTKRHRTEYCYRIHVTTIGSAVTFAAGRIGNFNGADDECYRQPAPYVRPGKPQRRA